MQDVNDKENYVGHYIHNFSVNLKLFQSEKFIYENRNIHTYKCECVCMSVYTL